jgi:DegV family protein with EDD domain
MLPYSTGLITDSTCDIPEDLIERYEILVVPQIILWGREQLRDRVDIKPKEFYRRLALERELPTTSQVTLADLDKAFRTAKEKGAREILVVTISSAMSGTYQTARNAAEQMDIPVHVVDSKGPTMSLGWQALAAARVRAAGGDIQAMIAKMDQVRCKLVQQVSLDTLTYLRRGGRIGNAAWLAGTLLNIKPLVRINHQTGLVEASDRARTRRKALELLVEKFFEEIEPGKPLRMAVLHGNAPDEAGELAERIRHEFSPVELIVNITGPVLGLHTGPRALALCGYTEE